MAEITMLNVAGDKNLDLVVKMADHQLCDVIAVYGAESGWTPEQINAKVVKYRNDIVKFATDEGLISTNTEKKIFEYSTHATLADAAIKFIVLDLGMSREDFISVLPKVREGFKAVVDCFGNIVVETVSPEANLKQPEADLFLQAGAPVVAKTAIEGKSIVANGLVAENAPMTMAAAGDCSVSGYVVSGQIKKTDSNACLAINAGGDISVTDSEFSAGSYNALEIGLNNTFAPSKNITIKGVDFSGELKNNGISIYGFADDAVVNIEDIHISSVSNALRISNKTNAKNVTINLKNVRIDKWDNSPAYAGAIIFQEYNSKSADEAFEANQFGPEKFTINFIDCYGPHGKIMAADASEVCATGNEKQVMYVYVDTMKAVLPYDASMYPTVTFK